MLLLPQKWCLTTIFNRELLRLDVKELTWQLLPFIREEEVGDPWDTVRRFNFKEETTMALPQSVLSLPKAESSPALWTRVLCVISVYATGSRYQNSAFRMSDISQTSPHSIYVNIQMYQCDKSIRFSGEQLQQYASDEKSYYAFCGILCFSCSILLSNQLYL